MIFYINQIMDLLDIYNLSRDTHQQLDIYDILEDIDDIDNEQDIQRAIKEIELRL